MHRNRTWTLDPPEWRTQRNRLLPIEGGDGSTLNLDFTTGVLDPRLTFSRASTATFVNSSGYVEYAGANTAPYSESLITAYSDNAILSRSTTTSPTGNTAVVFYPTLVLDYHRLQFGAPIAMVGATTVSVYVKQIGSDYRVGINAIGYIAASVIFSLVGAGSVVGSVGGTAPNRAATITKVTDDGWYRITLTGTYTALASVYVYMTTSTSTDTTGQNFVGVASQGIAIWGLQVNPGSTAQTYYPTTTAAYHAPRFDYDPTTLVSKGLLLEGASTNTSTYSEDFTNAAWSKVGATTTLASGISPVNENTAILISETTASGYAKHCIERSITVTPGSIYTFSVFLKEATSNSRRYAAIQIADGQTTAARNTAVVDLQTGTITASGTLGGATNTSSRIVKYPNGWYRISITMTHVLSPCYPVVMLSDVSTLSGGAHQAFYTATNPVKGLLVYGAQLELGSGESSYIPTGASTVARTEDMAYISGTNFSSWFTGASTGTMLVEYYRSEKSSTAALPRTILATREAANQHFHLKHDTSGTTVVLADSAADKATASYLYGGRNRTAFTYNGASNAVVRLVTNGETITTAVTSNTTPANATHLTLGYPSITLPTTNNAAAHLNSTISKIKYYPTVLTDNVLKEITSPNYVAPTLDLDFTTGVLDPRLTFSRASTATFVNSSGYVQFANANLFRHSENTTSWSGAQSITSTANAAIAPNGTLTADQLNLGSGDYFYNTTATTNPVGQQYVGSVWMRTVSGTASVGLRITNNAIGANSSIATCSVTETWQRFNTSPLTLTDTANRQIDIGVDQRSIVSGPAVSANIYIWGLQLQPGASVGEYLPTTTTENYSTPRFDNALLTSRTNLILQSNNFAPTTWVQKDGTHLATVTAAYEAAPPGFTGTATRITSSNAAAGITQALNVPLVSGKPIRISFYAKSNTVTAQNCMLYSNSSTSAVVTIPTTWTRIDEVGSVAITEITLKGFIDPLDISIYGMQVEYTTSGGATAYIPTTTAQGVVNTTEPRGLLIEGVGINLTTYSEDFANAVWTKDNSGGAIPVVTTVSETTPANGATVNQIVFDKTGGVFSRIGRTSTGTASTPYTMSVWMRTVSGSANVGLRIGVDPAGFNCAVTTTWKRFQYTYTLSSTDSTAQIMLWDSIIGNSETATVYVWGCQVEAGSGASSYIPTGASGVTRNTDYCTIPTASFIPGNPYPQTLFVDCIPNTPSGAFVDLVRVFDRTGSTFAYGTQIYYYNAPTMIPMRKIYASTNSERNLANGLAYGTRHKFALSIDAASYSGSYDGVTALGVATAPTALATVVTHMGIGCSGDSSAQSVMFGTIRQIKFYPTALYQSAINTLTTL